MSFPLCLVLLITMAPQSDSTRQSRADAGTQQVVLAIGEEHELDGGRARVKFENVLSDSRCPRGARCIRAGEAKVQVWFQQGSEPGRSHILVGPARSFSSVSRSYSVQVRSLEPYPEQGSKRPQEHVLTLLVLERPL